MRGIATVQMQCPHNNTFTVGHGNTKTHVGFVDASSQPGKRYDSGMGEFENLFVWESKEISALVATEGCWQTTCNRVHVAEGSWNGALHWFSTIWYVVDFFVFFLVLFIGISKS